MFCEGYYLHRVSLEALSLWMESWWLGTGSDTKMINSCKLQLLQDPFKRGVPVT